MKNYYHRVQHIIGENNEIGIFTFIPSWNKKFEKTRLIQVEAIQDSGSVSNVGFYHDRV